MAIDDRGQTTILASPSETPKKQRTWRGLALAAFILLAFVMSWMPDTPHTVLPSAEARAAAPQPTIVIGGVVLIAALAVAARAVSPMALPIVAGAALLCTYLVALVVAPKENASGLARFDTLLMAFFKLLAGGRSGDA